MAKASNWKALPSYRRIDTAMPSCPVIGVATAALPAADLLAIADKEAADGWPAPIVSRTAARRANVTKMWVGPKGICFGPQPDLSIAGRNMNWIKTIARERPPNHLYNVATYPLSTAGIVPNDGSVTIPKLDTMYESLDHAAALVRYLVGDETLLVTSMTAMRPANQFTAGYIDDYMAGLPEPLEGHFVVAYASRSYKTYPAPGADDRGIAQTFAVCQVAKRPEYEGIEKMVFHHSAGTWADSASTYEGAMLSLSGIKCQPGLWNLMQVFDPKLTGVHHRTGGGRSYCKYFSPTVLDTSAPGALFCGLTPAASVHSSSQLNGIRALDVYHIGDPEFAENVAFLGDVTASASGWTMSDTSMFIEWRGERLIDMNPSMAEVDRERLRGKYITTHMSDTALYDSVSLTNLSMYADAADAGLNLATEVFMPAKEGNPAVTFAEAVTRANAADKRLFHRIVGHEPNLAEQIAVVKIINHPTVANSRSCVGYYAGGTTTDKDVCMLAVAGGAAVINGSSFVGDVVVDFFGLTEAELRANNYRVMRKFEFSESYVFRGAVPDVRKLDAPVKTAQLLVQHALNRKSFSQFAVGAVTMASVARRQLL